MSGGAQGGEWRVSDVFGDEWRISVVPAHEQLSAQRAVDWEERSQLDRLVMDGFTHSGATDDRTASVLLEIYDGLTNGDLSKQLPVPTEDPQRLLCGLDLEILSTLLSALTFGALRIEPIARARWTFPEDVEPAKVAPQAVVEEETTFIAIELVDQNGKRVPRRRYQITLPDGTVRQGNLGSDGTARVDEIALAGECQVDFLDFDEVDWGPQTLQPGATQPGTNGPVTSQGRDSGETAAAAPDGTSPDSGATAAAAKHMISHTFVDRSGSPIADIAWQVTGLDGTVVRSGVTDASGVASCEVPKEGDYELTYDHSSVGGSSTGDDSGTEFTEVYD